MFRLAVRNLLRKRTRSLLSMVGLAVALVLVIGLISFSNGVRKLVSDTMRQVQGLVVVSKQAPDAVLSVLPASLEADLAKEPGVAAVVPEIWHFAMTIDGGEFLFKRGMDTGGLVVLGLDPDSHARLPGGGLFARNIIAGRFLTSDDDAAILLSRETAEKLGQPLHSTINLALLPEMKVVGIFETGSLILDHTVVVPMRHARAMKQLDPQFVSSYYIELDDPDERTAVAERLNAKYDTLQAFTPETVNQTVGDVLVKLDNLLLVITVLPIVGAGVAILNTMMMSFSERIREFGILKACGWRRREILALVIVESVLLGLAGGALGCALGGVGTWALADMLSVTPVTPPWLYGACMGLAILLGVGGGAYPAARAALMTPLDAIRNNG